MVGLFTMKLKLVYGCNNMLVYVSCISNLRNEHNNNHHELALRLHRGYIYPAAIEYLLNY